MNGNERQFHSKLDELINKYKKMSEDLEYYTSKYANEHWETLVSLHLEDGDDMSDELYIFMVDELNSSFDKLHTRYNLMHLFELDIDDLKLTEERSIELLYAMITKVSASILIMNQLEKYENSAVLNRKLEDLYVLIHCSVQEEYISPIKLKEEYKNIMTEVFKSVGNTKYFNDNV